MNRSEAEQYIKDDLAGYLTGKGININKPFICLNPDHTDHKPSMSYDKKRKKVHCFSCGADYSTIDLIGIEYGITDLKAMYEKAFEIYGITPGVTITNYRPANKPQDLAARRAAGSGHKVPLNVEKFKDQLKERLGDQIDQDETTTAFSFKGHIIAAHEALLKNPAALAHFEMRGLSLDIIKRYKLGFCSGGYNEMLRDYPDKQSRAYKQGLYKYIFPYQDEAGEFPYFQSEIYDRNEIDEYNGKYKKITGIKCPLFNERYLKTNTPEVIFLCEGIFDALSVEQCGGHALAFMGTGQERFLNICKEYRPKTIFVLMLDRDEAGEKAAQRIRNGLKEININCVRYKQPEELSGKDPNEDLQKNPVKFKEMIEKIIEKAPERFQAAEDPEPIGSDQTKGVAEMFKSSLDYLDEFKAIINDNAQAEAVPTGFKNLDDLLDGGLYPGLYIIGAISSLGKTTFCLQMADNIAAHGRPVLFFSLEMARAELQAKSISRETFIYNDLKKENSKTTRGIMNGHKYGSYSKEERAAISGAMNKYKTYAENVYIYEGRAPGGDRIGAAKIREIITSFKAATGKTPVVYLDYLQILAPEILGGSDKQNTDLAVFELKEISRDFKTPVFVISSFNRDNYTSPVNMASFKESGAVEYSSDVLIGLQPSGMDYWPGETANDKRRAKRILQMTQENERRAKNFEWIGVQLKVLKNRNGAKGSCGFFFTSAFNHYGVMDDEFFNNTSVPPEPPTEETKEAGADPDGFKPVDNEKNPFEDMQNDVL